jgi:hypothetical protein
MIRCVHAKFIGKIRLLAVKLPTSKSTTPGFYSFSNCENKEVQERCNMKPRGHVNTKHLSLQVCAKMAPLCVATPVK